MRILNEKGELIRIEDCDLSCGYLFRETIVKEEAVPIDNITKFAWDADDYEEIQRYVIIPENDRIEQRISFLKSQLNATDYVIIKIVEGVATKEDYAQVILNRESLRAEINELELKLKEN